MTNDTEQPDSVEIPGIGTFLLEEGRYVKVVPFRNQNVPFVLSNSARSKLADKWKIKMGLMCQRFLERFESQADAICEKTRILCREYDLYENVEIPWSNAELLADLNWYDVKFTNSTHSPIECCAEPRSGPMSNFSLIIGFNDEMELAYCHFDG